MAFLRGSNPIWYEADLTAHAFDDTFYLFILDNEIPYQPLPVYQDTDGNVAWTNPIRFYANGTLPNNIYYDSSTTYRLEFRQGPTQSDPLIYLVENYQPGNGGSSSGLSLNTDNQVSNPQFALINFTSPLTLNSISTQVIGVAPGWSLNLTGTGGVVLTQVLLNSAVTSDPTNASYALRIQLSGSWTKAYLSQRFSDNGVLWSNTYVSSSITALSGDAPQNISASLVDSQSTTLASVLAVTPLSAVFNEYTGIGQVLASTNTDLPPAAYIEYQLLLPNNCDVTITSIQLASGDTQAQFPYEQTTIQRQIDQTYHNSFPIVPIGTIIDFAGFTVPLHYLVCNGAAVSRITYDLLFQALTFSESVTLTQSTDTFTSASPQYYYIGMKIESTAIPAATTVSNISGSTITISANATATGIAAVRIFAWGDGDGSTTFNLPSLSDYVTAGSGGSLFGATANVSGYKGGAATSTALVNHTHGIGSPLVNFVGTGSGGAGPFSGSAGSAFSSVGATATAGTGSSFSLAQQTALVLKCIRYEY